MACAGIAGAQTPDPRATTHIIDFPHCCPRSGWWDEVEIETRIDSMETFLAVWQNQALTDEQKAKALFQAIEDFVRRDDDITAAAVNYYYWVDRDYDHIRRLYEFGVGHYLDYDRPLENYGGKAGDMSAGILSPPNSDGLAPGEITEMYSFDHDLGQFVAIGTGTVSEDGLTIASNAGVVKAGWTCAGNTTQLLTSHAYGDSR